MSAQGPQLRIALGMRGGVSLAVWIGGACHEIDALRISSQPAGGGFWSRVLRACDVSDVIVDVMAGASAGGLNGVIYAASQVYGFSLAELRGAWLEVGGLQDLVRPAEGDQPVYPSLLQGDEYFFARTCDKLTQLVQRGDPPASRPQVDLTLTATLVEPVTRPAGVTHPGLGERGRFGSTFRFRHRGPAWLTDFPDPGTPELERTIARLALAARATSSYPVAFEAAAIHAHRPPSFAGTGGGGPAGAAVDMAGVFGDATSGQQPFLVMDGGVLDNIPLGRALAAIGGATADRRTRRVLVYVRPGAPPTAETVTVASGRRSTWSVLQGLLRARIQPETIIEDLTQVEEHNRRVQRSQRLRLLAFTAAEDRGTLRRLSEAATDAYLVQRADVEAQEVLRLLEDPVGALGEDPFPAAPGVDDGTWRAPLARWERAAAERLDGALAEVLCGRMKPSPLDFGVGPLGRLCHLLLEWARFVERAGEGTASEEASRHKAELYRVLTVYRELLARPRRLGWVVLAARQQPTQETWEADAVDAVEALLHVTDDEAEAVAGYLATGGEATLAPVRHAVLARLDALLSGQAPPGAGGGNLRAVLLDFLLQSARSLAALAVPAGSTRPGADAGGAAVWLHRALATPGSSDTGLDRAHLEALEVVAFPESLVGAAADSPIHFVELSSASPTAISSALPKLLGVRRSDDPWGTIAARLNQPGPPEIRSDDKLAGNELNNFSAFLRERWRANDWMWGRLDAVPTLVQLLVTPDSLRAVAADLAADGADAGDVADRLLARVRAAVTGAPADGEGGDPETSWPAFLRQTAWDPRQLAIDRVVQWAVSPAAAPSKPDSSDLQALWDALVSARQWEILSDELALQRGRQAWFGPRRTVEEANDYGVGVETLTNPPEAADSDLISRTVRAGRRMLQENLHGHVPAPVLGVVQAVGLVLSWAWVGRRTTFKLTLGAVTALALALALVVLPVAGSDAHGWSRLFSVGAVPGAALVLWAVIDTLFKRWSRAAGLFLVGAGLVGLAAVAGGNWRASAAVFAVALVVVAAGLWTLQLVRPKPGD